VDGLARERSGLTVERSLAPLTGQDKRALAAVATCWELYASSDEQGASAALQAVAWLLEGMQPTAWHVARALIAYAMDWSDIERVWKLIPTAVRRVR
jgi:hypothetical protein